MTTFDGATPVELLTAPALVAAPANRLRFRRAPSPTRDAQPTHRAYQPLVVMLAASCAGILLDRQIGAVIPLWLGIGAVAVFGWLLLGKLRRDTLAAMSLIAAVLAIGGAWHHFRWHYFAANEIGLFARETPEPLCIDAVAATSPRHVVAPSYDPLRPPGAKDSARMAIELRGIRDGGQWRTASGDAELVIDELSSESDVRSNSATDDRLPEIHAGDRLRIFGRFTAPAPASNPGEPDLAELARGHRQMALVRAKLPECVTVLEPSSGWSLGRLVDGIRSRGHRMLWEYLPPDRAGLAVAILFGEREELQSDRVQNFVLSGSIHILVVAGLHVGILAFLLFKGLRCGLLPRTPALIGVIGLTGLYALVTDSGPSVIRATAMVWIYCVSLLMGRSRPGLNTLAAAGLLVLVFNPTDLFRMGTQLSFLCVAALVIAQHLLERRDSTDPIDRLIAQSRPWPVRLMNRATGNLWRTTLAGLIMWLVTVPLVMARYHLIAPAAVMLNPLLIFPLTLAMMSGFGIVLFGGWLSPVAALCGWVCNWNLGALEWAVSRTAAIPWSHFWVPGPREWWLIGLYVGLAWAGLIGWRMPPRRWRIGLLAAWCGVGFGAAWLCPVHSGGLDCTFVSVGHGCAVVLELPGGGVLLSDAGRLNSPIGGARDISSYLWSRGLTHIDAIVISHNDTDHFNAVPELLERFSVGAVYVSPVMFNRDTGALRALRQAVERAKVPLRETSAGDRLASGDDSRIDVLHPPPDGMGGTENADSICLSIQWRGWRLLMTGDLASPGLETVVAESTRPYDVAMVPHHGSATSSPATFAAWCRAHWAVISGDLAHDSRIAVAAYKAAGSEVLNTATSGAVHFGVSRDGCSLHCDCFRRGDRW